MAYTVHNYKTKKALREALKAGDLIEVYQPGPFGGPGTIHNGTVYLEGPHYPEPHKWYAKGEVKDGKLIKVS